LEGLYKSFSLMDKPKKDDLKRITPVPVCNF
jgi:hypothetical protein